MDRAGRLLNKHQTSVCELAEVGNNPAEAKNVMLKSTGEEEAVCMFFGTNMGTGSGVAGESER